MATQVQVDLESTARRSEVNGVRSAFKDAGIDADVSANVVRKGAGEFPWVIFITVDAGIFFGALMKSAGEAMGKEIGQAAGRAVVSAAESGGRRLKRLIDRLYESRKENSSPKGAVLLRLKDVHEEVLMSEGTPEEAYQLLLELDVRQTDSGQLRWDPEAKAWRDSWDVRTPTESP